MDTLDTFERSGVGQAEIRQTRIERLAADAEPARRFGAIAIGERKRPDDQGAFELCEGVVQRKVDEACGNRIGVVRGRIEQEGEIFAGQQRGRRKRARAFDGVGEFPHVAGPAEADEQALGVRGEVLARRFGGTATAARKCSRQRQNVG